MKATRDGLTFVRMFFGDVLHGTVSSGSLANMCIKTRLSLINLDKVYWYLCRSCKDVMRLFEEAFDKVSFRFEKLYMYLPFLQLS